MAAFWTHLRSDAKRGLADLLLPVLGVVAIALLVITLLVALAARELNRQA